MKAYRWQARERTIEIAARPLVMGILNVTPDSFSDGGKYLDHSAAVDRGLALVAEGADILDIGGESTRPNASPVPLDEELRRVLPVIRELSRQVSVPLSIDTMKAELARRAMEAGASIINDVSGLRDPRMIEVAAEYRAGVVVMHMQGAPETMQQNPHYVDVVREMREFFEERLHHLAKEGIPPTAVCLDPGIGFGKTREHNLQLLAGLSAFRTLERPICLGVSRKGFIDRVCGRAMEPLERMPGSLAVACFAAARGEAQVLRVHDVQATRDASALLEAIDRYRP